MKRVQVDLGMTTFKKRGRPPKSERESDPFSSIWSTHLPNKVLQQSQKKETPVPPYHVLYTMVLQYAFFAKWGVWAIVLVAL